MYEHELDVALKIVKDAGSLALRLFEQSVPEEAKADRSPVTRADREGERVIARALQEAFPDDGILGEEGAQAPSRSGRRWLIDPVDGTKDFVRGNPHWAVQLALQTGDRVVAGVVYCPCLGEVLFAADGEGAWHNGARTMASAVTQMEKAVVTISGFNAAWRSWPEEGVRELTRRCWTVRCYGGAYNVLMLARGKVDVWLSGRGMEWDYAPAQVIARECGACFLTRDGGERIDERHALVCAPGIFPELVEILQVHPF
ncbi:MAG: inositol monophosphatase [Acidobacteriota bacterium]|jgi:fructose-1,6-bisphosphatase/inositol monophosphatase family enzyme|nr:inositol monophosphatase [Acidobacteriota bacterium]